jgi:NADH-quinone oxidoreductase subunit N
MKLKILNEYYYNTKSSIGLIEISPIHLFDGCYLFTEIFLFFSLTIILLQYSFQINKVIRIQHYFLQNTIGALTIEYFLILNKKLNAGLLITINKIIKIFKICILFLLLNPVHQLTSKYLLGGFLITMPIIVFLKIIILICGIIILRSNFFYFFYENNRNGDFVILFGFIIFSMLLFLHTADFFILFLLFEIIALLFYIVLAIQKTNINIPLNENIELTKYQKILLFLGNNIENTNNLYSVLSSLVYFILNALITTLFLFFLSSILIIFQTTNFLNIAIILNFKIFNINFPLLILSLFAILSVFFFKLSIVPFHGWIPAVFEGAPYIAIMFLAIPMKICVLFLLIKILYLIFNTLYFIWQPLLILVSLLSMIIGSLSLLFQTKLKKFWAYSTINHMGYILLSLSTNSWIGIRSTLIYFFSYILMNFGFFIMCLILTNDSLQQRIIFLNHFAFIKDFKNTLTAVLFSIIIFSLIGIPPLFGFWGKFFVLICILTTLKTYYLWFIIIVILLTSVIATAAYLRIWKIIFIEENYNITNNIEYEYLPIPIENIKYLCVLSLIIFIGPIIFQGEVYTNLDFIIKAILLNSF